MRQSVEISGGRLFPEGKNIVEHRLLDRLDIAIRRSFTSLEYPVGTEGEATYWSCFLYSDSHLLSNVVHAIKFSRLRNGSTFLVASILKMYAQTY